MPFVVAAAAGVGVAAAAVVPWLWWMKACCWLYMSSRSPVEMVDPDP